MNNIVFELKDYACVSMITELSYTVNILALKWTKHSNTMRVSWVQLVHAMDLVDTAVKSIYTECVRVYEMSQYLLLYNTKSAGDINIDCKNTGH